MFSAQQYVENYLKPPFEEAGYANLNFIDVSLCGLCRSAVPPGPKQAGSTPPPTHTHSPCWLHIEVLPVHVGSSALASRTLSCSLDTHTPSLLLTDVRIQTQQWQLIVHCSGIHWDLVTCCQHSNPPSTQPQLATQIWQRQLSWLYDRFWGCMYGFPHTGPLGRLNSRAGQGITGHLPVCERRL